MSVIRVWVDFWMTRTSEKKVETARPSCRCPRERFSGYCGFDCNVQTYLDIEEQSQDKSQKHLEEFGPGAELPVEHDVMRSLSEMVLATMHSPSYKSASHLGKNRIHYQSNDTGQDGLEAVRATNQRKRLLSNFRQLTLGKKKNDGSRNRLVKMTQMEVTTDAIWLRPPTCALSLQRTVIRTIQIIRRGRSSHRLLVIAPKTGTAPVPVRNEPTIFEAPRATNSRFGETA
jgi:hypothetical protein